MTSLWNAARSGTPSPGGQDEHPGLFRLEVTEGPGSGVRVLNNPVPAAFKESIRCAEQNLYARAMQLVGDRDPRAHEFSVQLRAFDAAKSGAKTGVASSSHCRAPYFGSQFGVGWWSSAR